MAVATTPRSSRCSSRTWASRSTTPPWTSTSTRQRLATSPPQLWSLSWVADFPGPNDFLGVLLGTGSTANQGGWSSTRVRRGHRRGHLRLRPGASATAQYAAAMAHRAGRGAGGAGLVRNVVLARPDGSPGRRNHGDGDPAPRRPRVGERPVTPMSPRRLPRVLAATVLALGVLMPALAPSVRAVDVSFGAPAGHRRVRRRHHVPRADHLGDGAGPAWSCGCGSRTASGRTSRRSRQPGPGRAP